MPTDEKIEEAKGFLRKRIDAELSAKSHIEEYMVDAARKIVKISNRYNISPRLFRFSANDKLRKEVDAVIRELKEQVIYATETLSVYDRKDDMDDILAFLNTERYGKTFRERTAEYANRYKFELEAAIAAGLFMNRSQSETLTMIRRSLTAPYNNSDIKASFGNGLLATRIETKGISYGVGKSNSAYTLITSLSRNEIASAWMWWYGEKAIKEGATGFYSYRGSSYPCAICNDNAGIYHPISEYHGHYHPRCCCYFVFV